ncbi:MAG TPA: hypothetical protein VN905_05075 [Candidatus Binatia bacterium]|nr:hypothetical protein [Candidatus Binatia bacterium]
MRAAALVLAFVLATALPAAAAGTMMLRFRVNGPLDFTKVRYVMLFNTTGNGMEPYANPMTGFSNYSFAWVVGGSGGIAQPQLLQYFAAAGAGTGLQTRPIVVPPQFVQLLITSSGAPGEFTLTFNRAIFNVPSPTGQKLSPIWSVNFVTTDLAGNPIDANGTTGITDVSFLTYARINTAQSTDLHYFKPAGSTAVSNPSAAIAQNEVINNP